MKCSLCKNPIKPVKNENGFTIWIDGNNPWPLRNNDTDRCCDICNQTKVIPARILMLRK